jgi:hypothetical protein
MASGVIDNSSETNRLLRGAAEGQPGHWDALVQKHRPRLRRMVSLRLDRRLRGWVDPSDVIRRAAAAASSRFERLNNAETAAVLGLPEAEASTLYIRSLKKLKDSLRGMPGGVREQRP